VPQISVFQSFCDLHKVTSASHMDQLRGTDLEHGLLLFLRVTGIRSDTQSLGLHASSLRGLGTLPASEPFPFSFVRVGGSHGPLCQSSARRPPHVVPGVVSDKNKPIVQSALLDHLQKIRSSPKPWLSRMGPYLETDLCSCH
jgi:hypothetical protein